jgi:hypothetical protein
MTAHFALISTSDELLRLVAEFAQGLGGVLEQPPGPGSVRVQVPDIEDTLLSLLTFVALSAMKLRVNLDEPLCEVTYQHGAEVSQVTLSLRISDIHLHKPSSV